MLRGVFLTSSEPARLARWYRDVARLTLEEMQASPTYTYWRADDGRMQLAIHEAAPFAAYASPPVRESNLTHLYFHIDDQVAFLAHLRALGITPESTDEVVVTIVDPDGRRVLFGTA